MGAAGGEAEAGDGAAGRRLPVRRTETGQGGHDIGAAIVGDGTGERLALRREAQQLQVVAKPLDQAAGDKDRAFQRISTGAAQLPGAGGEQAVMRDRSEEHTSELQSLMRISYAVFCLKKTIK